MVITDFLERNARLYGSDVALVEINPSEERDNAVTWRDYSLIESASPDAPYRREMTWKDFERRANRFANLLLSRGLERGTKVGILLMNCLEWLPLYFGILKAGCVAVPMNYRYSSEEIAYCVDLADVEVLVFGPEFVSRVDPIVDKMTGVKLRFYVGRRVPAYAEDCCRLSSSAPRARPRCADRGGRRGDLFLLRHDRLPQGHPAQAPLAARRLPDRTASPRADPRRRVPVHPAALPHGRQDALVRLAGLREQGRAAARRQARVDPARGHRGEMHIVWLLVPWCQDILESIESGRIDLSHYMLDQWRLMHIGAQPVPPSMIHRWLKIFPHHQYDTNYGCPNPSARAACIWAWRTSTRSARSASPATSGRPASWTTAGRTPGRAKWAS